MIKLSNIFSDGLKPPSSICWVEQWKIPSWKQIRQWKITIFYRRYIFKWLVFPLSFNFSFQGSIFFPTLHPFEANLHRTIFSLADEFLGSTKTHHFQSQKKTNRWGKLTGAWGLGRGGCGGGACSFGEIFLCHRLRAKCVCDSVWCVYVCACVCVCQSLFPRHMISRSC